MERRKTQRKEQTKVARFWVWWNQGYVKLTLREGKRIDLSNSEATDEGYNYIAESYTIDGPMLNCEVAHGGSDCDGRIDNYREHEAPINELRYRCSIGECPEWQELGCSQRDQFAELAGY